MSVDKTIFKIRFKYVSYVLNLLLLGGILFLLSQELIWTERDFNAFLQPSKKTNHKNEFLFVNDKTRLQMKNVLFRFSDDIFLEVKNMEAVMLPQHNIKYINFDNIDAFKINIYKGEALVNDDTLEIIFNKLFTFKGTKLKELKVNFFLDTQDNKRKLKLSGKMKFGGWLKFKMVADLILDVDKQLMVIKTEKIHALANPKAMGLLKLLKLNFEKLLAVPSGNIIEVQKFNMYIKPLKIFPPPIINAKIQAIKITDNNQLWIRMDNNKKLSFRQVPNNIKNYLLVKQGMVKFGKLFMKKADLLMIDKDPSDLFDFYLKKYFSSLTLGHSKIKSNKSVIAYFPDYKL